MNLVQLANDLEFVPKEQLAQMSQDPNSNYPPYLVLSEIQRRTMNEKAYAAAKPQPTTTVAEEVVGEFMQPQGMQAGMPPESAPTDVFSSGMSGMPASAPMQQPMMMASGGSTSYFEGGPTDLTDQQYYSGGLRDFNDRLRNQSRIDAAQTSAQTAVTEGLDAAGQPVMSSQLVNQNIEPDEMEMEMGMAGGGLTAYANGGPLEQSFSDPMRQAMLAQLGFPSNMTDEELNAAIMEQRKISDISSGSNAPKTAGDLGEGLMQFAFGDERLDSETPITSRMTDEFTDYLNVIPGLGGLALAGKAAIQTGKAGVKKGLQKLGDRARKNDPTLKVNPTTGRIASDTEIGGNIARDAIGKTKSTLFGSVPRAATTTYGAGMIGQGISNLASQGETVNQSDPFYKQNEDGTFSNTYTEELNAQRIQADIEEKQKAITDEANKKEALRIQALEKAERRDRGYDLAQLGGLIMGSKSLGDLGMGIAGMAQQKQARETSGKELDLKTRLTEAQIEQIQDKSKYSETDALQAFISSSEKNITELVDAGTYTKEEGVEELKKLEPYKIKLRQLLQNMFGDMQVNNVGSDEQFLKSLSA